MLNVELELTLWVIIISAIHDEFKSRQFDLC